MSTFMMGSKVVRGMSQTDESDRDFVKFFGIVQKAANDLGCVFFLWSPEGKIGLVGDVQCENLSGWLIPVDEADAFESLWEKRDDSLWGDVFFDAQAFALWSEGKDHEVTITFEFPLKGIAWDD